MPPTSFADQDEDKKENRDPACIECAYHHEHDHDSDGDADYVYVDDESSGEEKGPPRKFYKLSSEDISRETMRQRLGRLLHKVAEYVDQQAPLLGLDDVRLHGLLLNRRGEHLTAAYEDDMAAKKRKVRRCCCLCVLISLLLFCQSADKFAKQVRLAQISDETSCSRDALREIAKTTPEMEREYNGTVSLLHVLR